MDWRRARKSLFSTAIFGLTAVVITILVYGVVIFIIAKAAS